MDDDRPDCVWAVEFDQTLAQDGAVAGPCPFGVSGQVLARVPDTAPRTQHFEQTLEMLEHRAVCASQG